MLIARTSSIITPAPSPITKPSRSLSNGREADCGVSLKELDRAMALMSREYDACVACCSTYRPNPATPSKSIAASVAPATITSASPWSKAVIEHHLLMHVKDTTHSLNKLECVTYRVSSCCTRSGYAVIGSLKQI